MLKFNKMIGWIIVLFSFIPSLINANNLEKGAQYPRENSRGILVSQTFIKMIPSENVNTLFPEKNQREGDISQLPKYDIDLYRIVYASIHADELVNLSGLIVVPKKEGMLPHLQYHHGTMLPYP